MMTREQALDFYDAKAWEGMSRVDIARMQLREERLAVPWNVFQGAVEAALSRPVYTHEFVTGNTLLSELESIHGPAPEA